MTHPAILKAQELHDREGDMEPNAEALVASVNQITRRKATAYGAAQRIWGDLPKMYRACLIRADEVANEELTAALEAFELSLEYEDEIEDIAHAMAEHAPLQAAE